MRKSQIKIGSLLSYAQMAINIIIQLLYTPVMIRMLGQSEYGLYNTVSSTISMLSVLSLGFNSGYIRYYSIYNKNEDKESIKKLNGLFLIIFLIIGLIALICGFYLTFHLDIVFDNGLTSEEYKIAKVLMLLLTVNLSISFPMSVFTNIISAHERFLILKLLGMIKTVFSPLITFPLLLMGYRSIAMVAVTVSLSLITDCIYLYYVFAIMHEKFTFRDFEKKLFKNLFMYTIFIAINMIIDQINWNIDKILLGRYIGTAEVAIYSVGYTLYHSYNMFSTSISNVFTPRIHKLVNQTKENDKEQRRQLTDIFTRVGRIQFIILMLILSGVFFFGKYFIIYIWAGKEYGNAYYVALLLMFPVSIALIQNLGIEIQRAEDKHQFRSIAYLVMAIANLLLSIYLCQIYGAIGSAAGTAISLILANGILMNIYYYRKCNIDVIFFWKNIGRISVGLIPPILYGVFYVSLIHVDTLSRFIIGVLSYTVIYCLSMWFLGMNRSEKDLPSKPIKRILQMKVKK